MRTISYRLLLALAILALTVVAQVTRAQANTTTTTLAMLSNGSPVTTIAAGDVITLTATVVDGTTPVTPGQVQFCDAAAVSCMDIHLLGIAQLISDGTATVRFRPDVGTHSYKAVFLGTKTEKSSSSIAESLSVAGPAGSITELSFDASPDYAANVRVTGSGSVAPTGTITLVDTSNGHVLGTATLDTDSAHPDLVLSYRTPNPSQAFAFKLGADFNGDGIEDIAGSEEQWSGVGLGTLDGSFTPTDPLPELWAPAEYIAGMTEADLNSDGIPDLVSVLDWGYHESFGAEVQIYAGNGDGTFQDPGTGVLTENWNPPIYTADFNGDGVADLAAVDWGNNVDVWLGGSSHIGKAIASGDISFLAIGDFNGDGVADIVAAVRDQNEIRMYLGNGDGTFTLHSTISTSAPCSVMTIGDFNGDGKADLALSVGGSAEILLGDGTGAFTTSDRSYTAGYIAPADFNRDGIADLLMSYDHVLIGNGDGTFYSSPVSDAAKYDGFLIGNFEPGIYSNVLVNDYYVNDIRVLIGGVQSEAMLDYPYPEATHVVQANYSGDSNYAPSSSNTLAVPPLPAGAPVFSPAEGSFDTPQSITIQVVGNPARVRFTTDGSTPTLHSPLYALPVWRSETFTLKARVQASGGGLGPVLTATYTLLPASAPVISPNAGTFDAVQAITMSDATPHAQIHYTLDGSDPTIASPSYFQPITLPPGTWTIKALAHVKYMQPGSITTATVTVNPTAAPTIQLPGGTYSGAQSVTITDTTPHAIIHYTTDGSEPTIHSTVYRGPVRIRSGTVTLKAIAHVLNAQPSAVSSQTYTIQ